MLIYQTNDKVPTEFVRSLFRGIVVTGYLLSADKKSPPDLEGMLFRLTLKSGRRFFDDRKHLRQSDTLLTFLKFFELQVVCRLDFLF